MEIKIGIEETPRELVVSSSQAQDEVEKLIGDVLESGKGLLKLVDEKGRTFLVPGEKIAYVEIGPADGRRVGFAVGG